MDHQFKRKAKPRAYSVKAMEAKVVAIAVLVVDVVTAVEHRTIFWLARSAFHVVALDICQRIALSKSHPVIFL